jgi:hypothetical protein
MDTNILGTQISALCNLLKASSLYAESIREYNVSFRYKNICTAVMRTQKQLEDTIKVMNPSAKTIIEDAMDDDKIYYISEVVILMNSLNTEGCKEIIETLKKSIE